MTITKAIKCIVASVFACGFAGLGLGLLLGVVVPDYSRAMFATGVDPRFDPIAVGIGLGLTQGLGVGVIVGCVITLAVAWSSSRPHKSDAS